MFSFINFLPFYRRYGHFAVCNRICGNIRDRVSSEHLHFWLAGLQEVSIAEANLQLKNNDKLFNRISNSITNYCKATSSYKVNNLLPSVKGGFY